MGQYKVDFETMTWDTRMNGLRFKASQQGGKRLRLVEYTKDMEPHWCEKGRIGYILEGRFEIRFETELETFLPGDGVFIPPGKEHKHMGKALTDIVRVVFVEDI